MPAVDEHGRGAGHTAFGRVVLDFRDIAVVGAVTHRLDERRGCQAHPGAECRQRVVLISAAVLGRLVGVENVVVFLEFSFLCGGRGGVRSPDGLRPEEGHHVIDGPDPSVTDHLLDVRAERALQLLADRALEVLVEVHGDGGVRPADDDPVVGAGRGHRQHHRRGFRPVALDGDADQRGHREQGHDHRSDDGPLPPPRAGGFGGPGLGRLLPPAIVPLGVVPVPADVVSGLPRVVLGLVPPCVVLGGPGLLRGGATRPRAGRPPGRVSAPLPARPVLPALPGRGTHQFSEVLRRLDDMGLRRHISIMAALPAAPRRPVGACLVRGGGRR